MLKQIGFMILLVLASSAVIAGGYIDKNCEHLDAYDKDVCYRGKYSAVNGKVNSYYLTLYSSMGLPSEFKPKLEAKAARYNERLRANCGTAEWACKFSEAVTELKNVEQVYIDAKAGKLNGTTPAPAPVDKLASVPRPDKAYPCVYIDMSKAPLTVFDDDDAHPMVIKSKTGDFFAIGDTKENGSWVLLVEATHSKNPSKNNGVAVGWVDKLRTKAVAPEYCDKVKTHYWPGD